MLQGSTNAKLEKSVAEIQAIHNIHLRAHGSSDSLATVFSPPCLEYDSDEDKTYLHYIDSAGWPLYEAKAGNESLRFNCENRRFTEGHWRQNIENQNFIKNQKVFSNNDNVHHGAISTSQISPISRKRFSVRRKPVPSAKSGHVEADADTHLLNLKFGKTLQTCDTGCATYIDGITGIGAPQVSQSQYYLKQSLKNSSLCSTLPQSKVSRFPSLIHQPNHNKSDNLKLDSESIQHDAPFLDISHRSLQVSRQAPAHDLLVESDDCNQRKNLFLRDTTIFQYKPARGMINTKSSYLDEDWLDNSHFETNHPISIKSKCDQSIAFDSFTSYDEYFP